MLVGTEIGAALTALEALKPDVIGLNCATGPSEMTEHLRHLSQHARTFLSCLPNAGLPSVVDGRTHYDLTPDELAAAHDRFTAELGVNIVGGCCGTTAEEGQARTADWKVRVAKRIHDLAIERYGLESTDLIFDALTFPLGAGQE